MPPEALAASPQLLCPIGFKIHALGKCAKTLSPGLRRVSGEAIRPGVPVDVCTPVACTPRDESGVDGKLGSVLCSKSFRPPGIRSGRQMM